MIKWKGVTHMEEKKVRHIEIPVYVPENNEFHFPEKAYCYECNAEEDYVCKTRKRIRKFRDREFEYEERYAICLKCGKEVTIEYLIDENEKEFERISRHEYGLTTIEDIVFLMKKYDIGKRPLSKALGLGELTITRYLEGQIPSEKNAQLLMSVAKDFRIMEKYLEKNKANLNTGAYNKAKKAIEDIKQNLQSNSTIERFATYIIQSKYEITNMSLQKLLYYVKGFGKIFLNTNLFEERCEAWIHGPVFKKIYFKYKIFGNQTLEIEKDQNIEENMKLNESERQVVDFVLSNFAIYNGTILREMTHKEKPWKLARKGLSENERSQQLISDESIFDYFKKMDEIYSLKKENGVKEYIDSLKVM